MCLLEEICGGGGYSKNRLVVSSRSLDARVIIAV